MIFHHFSIATLLKNGAKPLFIWFYRLVQNLHISYQAILT